MKIFSRKTMVVLALVSVGAGAGFWLPQISYEQATAATDYQQLEKFSRVMESVRQSYVEEVDDQKLIEGALSGMLSNLDPHSAYLNEEAFKQMQVHTSGEFGGLGIEIVSAQGGIKVIAPIEDTPADRAGIKAGDLIIKIDDMLARDISLGEAVKMMRGKPGSSIYLTIFRQTEDKPLRIKIERDVIRVKSVKSDLVAPHIAYLRVTQFQEHTTEELKQQFLALKKRSDGVIKGAILDLRNNPGGLLNQAIEVSDLFLESGGIVSTKSRVGRNMSFSADAGDILEGLPLLVLINQGSASASEIVSGALQDNKRAIVLGTRSFGKGSVQQVIPLGDGTAYKMTTSLYYTPSGRSIQATGIEPDIDVEARVVHFEEAKTEDEFISEKDLKGHLGNGNGKPDASDDKVADGSVETATDMNTRLQQDYQLQRARDLILGLTALK
ncbi:MAG: S41 family peptidase [Zetaproteobacteria bacterium]|nr:S41 family peptidase [Zetaproteobacteria bacterium]